MYATQDHTLKASGEVTATGTSDWLDVSEYLEGQVLVNCSAVDSGASVTLTIEATNKGQNIVYTHTTFTAINGTGVSFKALTQFGAKIRLKWVPAVDGVTFSAIFVGKRLRR